MFDDIYNAADDLLAGAERHPDKAAYIDRDGTHTYRELLEDANRFANLLSLRGIRPEARVLLCMVDTFDLPVCFLGAIKAGAVPIPTNTLLTAADYNYILEDSRAEMLVVSEELRPAFDPHIDQHAHLLETYTSGPGDDCNFRPTLNEQSAEFVTHPTRRDDVAFWLYTSGTTGRPKGVMHYQTDLVATDETYAQNILGLTDRDVVYSAAKLFFAYGLGNSLTFPLRAGATTVLLDERPTPESIQALTSEHPPTVFFGVPTLYAMILNTGVLPETGQLRLCVSAGEALPGAILSRWLEATGVSILDGLGSTEMLHIFISNTREEIHPGTSGKPVPGYEAELRDDQGNAVPDGELGDLWIRGPSAAAGYWNLRDTSNTTFHGPWVFTGDKYIRNAEGVYAHQGRSDDLIKVGGIYVSPGEVENALLTHAAVAEAAVVGAMDADELTKPRAYVVLNPDHVANEQLESELVAYVREELADYKRPRWIVFTDELPKTATGKIQRYKLREQ